jgi:predicted esterase
LSEAREQHIEVRRRARWFERGAPDAPHVWLVLHGYGQLASAFLESCAALARPERLLVAPEALSRFYLRSGRGPVGASWMTREARDDEVADYVEFLDALVDSLAARGTLETLTVLGFSQGVATAWRWTLRSRHPVARLVALGGASPPDVELASPKLRALHVVIATGEHDESFPPSAASADAERLAGVAATCEILVHSRGHEVDTRLLAQL